MEILLIDYKQIIWYSHGILESKSRKIEKQGKVLFEQNSIVDIGDTDLLHLETSIHNCKKVNTVNKTVKTYLISTHDAKT